MMFVDWIRFILGALLVIFGLFLIALEVFGSYKFDFVLNRMHVAAIGDTLGIGICMLGLIIFSGFNFTSVKILLVIIFLWIASPVSSHLIARFEVMTNDKIAEFCEMPEENVREDD